MTDWPSCKLLQGRCPTTSKAGRRPIGLDEVTETPSGSTRQKEPLLCEALSGVTDHRAFSGSGTAVKADSGPGSGSAHRRRNPRKAAKAPDMPALQNVSLANEKQSRTPLAEKPCATPPIRSGRAAKAITPARKFHVKTKQRARHPCACCCLILKACLLPKTEHATQLAGCCA